MLRTFTCIMCPQGCEITAEGSEAPYSITGNKCKRGHEYVEQELVNPDAEYCNLHSGGGW